jgi:hypothetical protein
MKRFSHHARNDIKMIPLIEKTRDRAIQSGFYRFRARHTPPIETDMLPFAVNHFGTRRLIDGRQHPLR